MARRRRTEDTRGPREPAGEAAPAGEAPGGAASAAVRGCSRAAVTLPWLLLYGVTGVSAVTRAAQAYCDGNKQVDAGYTRFVTPGELLLVGALLLAAFAVMIACALLLFFGRRSATAWLPLLVIAAGLTAGSVWAAARAGCILSSGSCSSSASPTAPRSPW